ncbi:MAG: hypothetical protein ACTSQE_07430 [Candidatus Heimdallarchaeaceae archaeon]
MKFKELSQRDPRWSKKRLGYGTGTISSYGCTLTCLASFSNLLPDELNSILKGSSYRNSAFAGSTKNLINWTKLESLTNGLIKFHWRGRSYNNTKVKEAIKKYGACLVEVDFDGTPRTNDRHWILLIGDKKAIDPWTGNKVPTNKYSIYTGYAIIEVSRKVSSIEESMQTNELLKHIGAENEQDAIKTWNKEMAFLKDERKKTKDLESKIISKEKTISELDKSHQSYLDKLASILWGEGEPTLSDEKAIREKIEELVKVRDNVDELEDKLDREEKKHSEAISSYEERLSSLKIEMQIMQDKHSKQIATVTQRVDKEIEELKKQREQQEIITGFINWISKIFKGGKS